MGLTFMSCSQHFPMLPIVWDGRGGWTDFCDVKCVRNDSSDTFLKWEDRLFIQEYCIGERV